jgi:hypothetical protein
MNSKKLIIPAILIPIILSSCGTKAKEPTAETPKNNISQSETIQFYKDTVTQLQTELSSLQEESYIMRTTYELKINELENQIKSLNKENDKTPKPESSTPNQTISEENHKTNFEYVIMGDGVFIKKYVGSSDTVKIPESIDGRPVTKIMEYAFSESKVKSVVISEKVNEIDWFVFYKCPFLEKIYIPSSVTSIGYGAFDYCSDSLIIYCDKDSYAEKYAKSFGISYELK